MPKWKDLLDVIFILSDIKVTPLLLILSVSPGCILIWEYCTDWRGGKQDTVLFFYPKFWALYIISKLCLKSVQLFSEFIHFLGSLYAATISNFHHLPRSHLATSSLDIFSIIKFNVVVLLDVSPPHNIDYNNINWR